MPFIRHSSFSPPFLYRNGHFQTIYASMFRKLPDIEYSRERILTKDDDFLDLDWIKSGSSNLVILCHGFAQLEYWGQKCWMGCSRLEQ